MPMSWWRSKKPVADAVPPREKLLEVARKVADACSWPWLEPVQIDLESRTAMAKAHLGHSHQRPAPRHEHHIVIRESDSSRGARRSHAVVASSLSVRIPLRVPMPY